MYKTSHEHNISLAQIYSLNLSFNFIYMTHKVIKIKYMQKTNL